MHVMFSSISHEFRTPINAFSNALSLLQLNNDRLKCYISQHPEIVDSSKNEVTKILDANNKYLKIGDVSTKFLMNLTEDILDFAKIEAGMFRLTEKPFLIQDLINEIEYTFVLQCTQKKLKFDITLPNRLKEATFNSDVGRIKQVLMNLISNSFKFTNKGGIELSITMKVRIITFISFYLTQFSTKWILMENTIAIWSLLLVIQVLEFQKSTQKTYSKCSML